MNNNNYTQCPNCGAQAILTSAFCKYCSTPIKRRESLTKDEIKNIISVALSMEEHLKSCKSKDIVSILSFVFFSITAIASYFLFDTIAEGRIAILLLTTFSALILFLLWGATISYSENKIISKTYQNDIKTRIEEYIISQNLSRYDFDHTAGENLPPKSLLRRFLFEK